MYSLLFIFTFILRAIHANDSPIIGILTQETKYMSSFPEDVDHMSYIAASYVKFVEMGGARVVPIWIGRDKQYYREMILKTNGLLLPGGSVYFNNSQGFGEAGTMLYQSALEINKAGDYYPIFAICLGMELLIEITSNGKESRTTCNAKYVSYPLEFEKGYKTSKIFFQAPDTVINILKSKNVTLNNHGFCITKQILETNNLTNTWRIVSLNHDEEGLEFVSTYESFDYPFFGVQFHPEKNMFEFERKEIPHTLDAVVANQYFSNFFVTQARLNKHKIDEKELEEKVIFNYNTTYVGKTGSSYTTVYLFTKENNSE